MNIVIICSFVLSSLSSAGVNAVSSAPSIVRSLIVAVLPHCSTSLVGKIDLNSHMLITYNEIIYIILFSYL